jgi:hypothetical protein
MPTLAADITPEQTYLPDPSGELVAGAHYTLDSETIRVTSDRAYERSDRGNGQLTDLGPIVARGVGGSTPAAHSSGATLTRYYPDAPGGGDGIPQGGPLSAPLDADDNDLVNLGNIQGNGTFDLHGAFFQFQGLAGGVKGGLVFDDEDDTIISGGGGSAGEPGQQVILRGGNGAGGSTDGASITLKPGGDDNVGPAAGADMYLTPSPGIGGGRDGLIIPILPTSDPAVAGALWNDTGTVKVSAG